LRSADSIRRFHEIHPTKPLIVVLTGTDVYRDIHQNKEAQQSLEFATRLVTLQNLALQELPKRFHSKTKVIYQSAEQLSGIPKRYRDRFEVCVIGHLRDEKDPLRTALAVRDLPRQSRIVVTHVGLALDKAIEKEVKAEVKRNPRYRWLGQLSHRKTRAARRKRSSHHLKMEGSSNVLSEALASGVPVIASKISGLMGTLGKRFAGYFPVGDTKKLRRLLLRAETDREFYRLLKRQCQSLAHIVKPKQELAAWKNLILEII
jgi:putative glycosyltransferase (TIGR04348 family)